MAIKVLCKAQMNMSQHTTNEHVPFMPGKQHLLDTISVVKKGIFGTAAKIYSG